MQDMNEVTIMAEGFVVDAAVIGRAFRIPPVSVPERMRAGEITSRCETGIDDDAGRFRLTFFCAGRALQLTVDAEGAVLSRATLRVWAPPALKR